MVEPMEPQPDPDTTSQEPSLVDQIASARLDRSPEPVGAPELDNEVTAALNEFGLLASRISAPPPVDELARRAMLRSVFATLDDDLIQPAEPDSPAPPTRAERPTAWLPRLAAAAAVFVIGTAGFVLAQSQLDNSSTDEAATQTAESDASGSSESSEAGSAAASTDASGSGQAAAPDAVLPPTGGPSPSEPKTAGQSLIDLGDLGTVEELRAAAAAIGTTPDEAAPRRPVDLGTCDVAALSGSPPEATALLAGRRVVTTSGPTKDPALVAVVDLEGCRLLT